MNEAELFWAIWAIGWWVYAWREENGGAKIFIPFVVIAIFYESSFVQEFSMELTVAHLGALLIWIFRHGMSQPEPPVGNDQV